MPRITSPSVRFPVVDGAKTAGESVAQKTAAGPAKKAAKLNSGAGVASQATDTVNAPRKRSVSSPARGAVSGAVRLINELRINLRAKGFFQHRLATGAAREAVRAFTHVAASDPKRRPLDKLLEKVIAESISRPAGPSQRSFDGGRVVAFMPAPSQTKPGYSYLTSMMDWIVGQMDHQGNGHLVPDYLRHRYG